MRNSKTRDRKGTPKSKVRNSKGEASKEVCNPNEKSKKTEKSKIRSFEDLELYKFAGAFRKRIYQLTKKLPKDEKYSLDFQMKKAAVSLINNIAEGYGRYHYQENIQFCRQSRGSLCELIDDLNVCMDELYIGDDEYESYREDSFHVLKVLNGYIWRTEGLRKESTMK